MLVTVYLYGIEGNWGLLAPDQVRVVYDSFHSAPLDGAEHDRYGFVQTQLLSDEIIYGFFVQEYRRIRVEYDEQKQERGFIEDDFERYLFAVDMNRRRLYLQHRRRVHDNLPSLGLLRERLAESLTTVLERAEVPRPTVFGQLSSGYARQDFLRLFEDPDLRVTFLRVSDLDASLLPHGFKFFNPRVDLNASFDEGFRRVPINTKNASLTGTKGGDLSKSPDARAYAYLAKRHNVMKFVSHTTGKEGVIHGEQEVKRELTIPMDDLSGEHIDKMIGMFFGQDENLHIATQDRRQPNQRRAEIQQAVQTTFLENGPDGHATNNRRNR